MQALQDTLSGTGLEALLVTHPANRLYLSGFDGTAGTLLVCPEEVFLAIDSRYLEQARRQSPHCTLVPVGEEGLAAALRPVLEEKGLRSLAYEEKHLTCFAYREYGEKLGVELIPRSGLVEEMRVVKEPAEIEILRRGAAALEDAFRYILERLAPGRTEEEVSLELEFYLRCRGAAAPPFRYIVASGERGALPHGVASIKALHKGELVTIDFGAVFEGYATDCTRTVCLGPPDGRQQEVHAAVREAQEKARCGLYPGISCREADALAREAIAAAGYGEHFGHGLGHGVGLEVHELPTLSPRSEGKLVPGAVFTVEPGIYLPGWGGVRIEDMMLMEAHGAATLTGSPRDLIVI